MESLNNKKFQKLSNKEMNAINGGQLFGFKVIYANQRMASVTGYTIGATGDYGEYRFFGIKTSSGFMQNDTYDE